jgi:SpoVK/Ycf46/Vps4 family AAA+-type ATPase
LGQEVRLLSPSDLRGAYLGWGQIQIREQFDWVAENDRRMLVIDELDAVARSRRQAGDMHSDEKANVNELLVQLDRAGRLGRLVVGTTNYMDSLDDAVVRSGRFGRFIPVPPPTAEEAVAILDYYLQRLCAADEAGHRPAVRVSPPGATRPVLHPLYAQAREERRFFCGADLEEAVNRAYYRCLRETVSGLPPGADYAAATVGIGVEDLARALGEVPRSVTGDAVTQFINDVQRYCGAGLARSLSGSISGADRGA